MAEYDVVFLGYPNWWGTMPMPVFAFLEAYDFSGKTVLPFCTHEGSGLGHSESDIKKLCPTARVAKGLAIQGGNVQKAESAIASWLQEAGVAGGSKEMSISEAARKNHEKLLPSHTFDAGGDRSGVHRAVRQLRLRRGAFLREPRRQDQADGDPGGSHREPELERVQGHARAAASTSGVTPVEAKEIVYQAVPYCGIAKVFDFIHATNEVLVSRGIKLPLEGQSTTSPETRFEKGLAAQKAIFGDR